MKITKFGHCCFLIEHKGLRILTDPGYFTIAEQSSVMQIDVVLITHEHGDHLHIESLKEVVKNNPKTQIITNAAVGKLLAAESIAFEIIDDQHHYSVGECEFKAYDAPHALIFETLPRVQNTGFLIDNYFFIPGDAYIEPNVELPVLAMPVAGPWLKVSDALDYAFKVKPQKAIPMHDGVLKNPQLMSPVYKMVLAQNGIEFVEPDGQNPFEV